MFISLLSIYFNCFLSYLEQNVIELLNLNFKFINLLKFKRYKIQFEFFIISNKFKRWKNSINFKKLRLQIILKQCYRFQLYQTGSLIYFLFFWANLIEIVFIVLCYNRGKHTLFLNNLMHRFKILVYFTFRFILDF